MSSPIVFDKDFDAKSIYVMKVYDAEVSKVWDYFTTMVGAKTMDVQNRSSEL